MQFFLIAALLAVVAFAGQCHAEDLEAEKQNYIQSLIIETTKNVAQECAGKVRTGLADSLKDTLDKYVTKFENHEPIYKKEGKEFDLWRFIEHSKMFKQLKTDGKSCFKDAKKAFNGAVKSVLKNIKSGVKSFIKSVKKLG